MCDYCNGKVPFLDNKEDHMELIGYITKDEEKTNTMIEIRYKHQVGIMIEWTNFNYCSICGEKLR